MLIELIKNWHWQHPLWLLWIPLLISLAVIYRKTQVHKGLWEKHIDKHLLDYLASNHHTKQNSRINQRFISSMAWIALIFCAIALAAPAWEKVEQPPITQQKRTIVILDMTLSMLVQDIKPSRAVRAKFKIRELLKSIPDGELALITFSGDAHIVSPFTEDFRAIDNLLAALSPDILPSIGSNPETAFALVNQMLEAQPKGYNSVVLLTDEILPSSVTNITQQLSPFINQLIVMGVGSSAGGLIPLSSGRFLKDDQGQIVSTQLDSRQLASFARQAGGSYLTLTNDNRCK